MAKRFTRTMGTLNDLRKAVQLLAREAREEGANTDITNVDWDKLEAAIQDEYDCGADGSIYDILVDLNDSVGLDEYDIHIWS